MIEETKRTRLAYEVFSFECPQTDRDLSVKVNDLVRSVERWAGHMGPVRVVSLSGPGRMLYVGKCFLTIEYTAHDTSKQS